MLIDVDAQLVARKLNEAFSNDDLWTSPSIVDDVEDLADEYDALTVENAKLRKLITGAYETMDAWQMIIANGSDTWGYGKGCLEQLWKLQDDMRELGIEVD